MLDPSIRAPAGPPFRLPFPPGKFTEVTSQLASCGSSLPPTPSRLWPETLSPDLLQTSPTAFGVFFHSCSLPSHSGLPVPECHSLSTFSASRPPCLVSGFSLHTYFPPHLPLHRVKFLPSLPALAHLTLLPGSPPTSLMPVRGVTGVFVHVCNTATPSRAGASHLSSPLGAQSAVAPCSILENCKESNQK